MCSNMTIWVLQNTISSDRKESLNGFLSSVADLIYCGKTMRSKLELKTIKSQVSIILSWNENVSDGTYLHIAIELNHPISLNFAKLLLASSSNNDINKLNEKSGCRPLQVLVHRINRIYYYNY